MMSDNLQLFKLFIIVLIFKYEDDDEQWWSDEVMMMIKANMLFCAYKHDKLNYENEFKASSTVVTQNPMHRSVKKYKHWKMFNQFYPWCWTAKPDPHIVPLHNAYWHGWEQQKKGEQNWVPIAIWFNAVQWTRLRTTEKGWTTSVPTAIQQRKVATGYFYQAQRAIAKVDGTGVLIPLFCRWTCLCTCRIQCIVYYIYVWIKFVSSYNCL